jgi:plastocyanin
MMRAAVRAACLGIAMAAAVPGGMTAASAKIVRIEVADLAFEPKAATVQAGDTVEWVNNDFVDHTATERRGRWEVIVPAGHSAHIVLREAGTVDYYCRFHPQMTGTLRVKAR